MSVLSTTGSGRWWEETVLTSYKAVIPSMPGNLSFLLSYKHTADWEGKWIFCCSWTACANPFCNENYSETAWGSGHDVSKCFKAQLPWNKNQDTDFHHWGTKHNLTWLLRNQGQSVGHKSWQKKQKKTRRALGEYKLFTRTTGDSSMIWKTATTFYGRIYTVTVPV